MSSKYAKNSEQLFWLLTDSKVQKFYFFLIIQQITLFLMLIAFKYLVMNFLKIILKYFQNLLNNNIN